MKTKYRFIAAISVLAFAMIAFFTACEEESTGPETVPIKAEIKQVNVLNSIFDATIRDDDPLDMDTVEISIPYGTDVSALDLDIIISYFGSIEPAAGITDLTNPVVYTVTSNYETREVMVMATLVPPALTSFLLTDPVEIAARIVLDTTGEAMDTIKLKIKEGTDLTNAKFSAEFFGESVVPDPSSPIDLSVEDPIISIVNKEFQTDYCIDIEWYKDIKFTGFIYDGTVHPNVIAPGAISEVDSAFISIEDDSDALGGKVAHFKNLAYAGNATGSANIDFAELGLTQKPEAVTVIMRGKGLPTLAENFRYVEMNIYLGTWRYQFWVTLEGLDGTDHDSEVPYDEIPEGLNPLEWNTYRLTANLITGEVYLYINENPDAFTGMGPMYMGIRSSENWRIGFGDGSGGNAYDGLYDYIVVETGGAFSPADLPMSKIFPEE